MKTSKFVSMFFLLPFIVFFVLFWLVPLIFGGYMSLHKYSLITGDQGYIGVENYTKILFSDSMYHRSFFNGLKNTCIFVLFSTPPLVIFSLGLAMLVDRIPDRFKALFRTIYFASFSVSVSAVAAIFIWLLRGNGGYINNMLINLSLISNPIPWLESKDFVWISITAATLWWTIGYNMMLFVNALNEIDISINEAAGLDGAGFWRKFVHITFPGIKDVFYFVLMTTMIASFNIFGQPRLMTNGGPGEFTKPAIMVINDSIIFKNNLGVGSAMTILLGVIIVACSISQYFLTRAKDDLNGGRV